MNWEAIGVLGELIGVIVIIVSILYLARQIHESNKHAGADAERQIQASFNSLIDAAYSDETGREITRRAYASFNSLSDSEKVFAVTRLSQFVNHLEMVLRMSDKGLIANDTAATFGAITISLLGTPGGREFWEITGGAFQKLSTEYINAHLATGGELASLDELFPFFVEKGA